jgi:hypothetical protein
MVLVAAVESNVQHHQCQQLPESTQMRIAMFAVQPGCSAAVPVPKGKPATALKLQGDKLVTAAGGKEIQIHGINW